MISHGDQLRCFLENYGKQLNNFKLENISDRHMSFKKLNTKPIHWKAI